MPVESSKQVVEKIFGSVDSLQEEESEAMETLQAVRVRDVMDTKFVMLHPKTTIRESIEVFIKEDIDGAPIVQDGLLKGIVTSSDVVQVFEEKALELSQHRHKAVSYRKEFRNLGDRKVGEIAEQEVKVYPSTNIFDAMTVMDENNLELIPVLDEAGKIRGVLRDREILKILLKVLV